MRAWMTLVAVVCASSASTGAEAVELDASTRLQLKPWGYQVFTN